MVVGGDKMEQLHTAARSGPYLQVLQDAQENRTVLCRQGVALRSAAARRLLLQHQRPVRLGVGQNPAADAVRDAAADDSKPHEREQQDEHAGARGVGGGGGD